MAFLCETMRSIASNHWRRLDGSVVVAESELDACGEADSGPVANAVDEMAGPERRASARETIRQIEEAFKGDGEALRVLAAMASGKSPREIQQEIGLDETRYASTRRRIRRRLQREFHHLEEGNG